MAVLVPHGSAPVEDHTIGAGAATCNSGTAALVSSQQIPVRAYALMVSGWDQIPIQPEAYALPSPKIAVLGIRQWGGIRVGQSYGGVLFGLVRHGLSP